MTGALELHSNYNIACFPNPKEVPPDDSSEALRTNTKWIFLGAPASLPYAITRTWSLLVGMLVARGQCSSPCRIHPRRGLLSAIMFGRLLCNFIK